MKTRRKNLKDKKENYGKLPNKIQIIILISISFLPFFTERKIELSIRIYTYTIDLLDYNERR